MTLISINRLVGIYYPHLAPVIFSLKKSWGMVAGAWALALGLMALPATKAWGQLGYQVQLHSIRTIIKRY